MPPIVLTFAASDPTGGAGLQADLLTLAALGCHPLSVVTALTVQDTRGVDSIDAVDAGLVERQAAKLVAEMKIAAFKLGVLGSAANVCAIAGVVARYPRVPLVLDPVLASGRGDPLGGQDVLDAMLELIVPRVTLMTPNTGEAKRLGGERALLDRGCGHVLVTGTHAETKDVVNTLYDAKGKVREDRWPRLPGSYHGSGCTLASACAAHLAHGLEVADAVRAAQEFTWKSLADAFRPADGQFIPWRK
jgi:hydroxymethylpyrimidine/phosphomethylpyrimidine kinase